MIDEVIITREWVLSRTDFECFSDEELRDICEGNDGTLVAEFDDYVYDLADQFEANSEAVNYV